MTQFIVLSFLSEITDSYGNLALGQDIITEPAHEEKFALA